MATRYFGEPVKRNEDERLLTGQALFVDDVELPGMLHAAFLRSHLAHGRIARVDAAPALGCSRSAISRSSVVFPQPDGPMKETNSPSAIARFTPDSAATSPSAAS